MLKNYWVTCNKCEQSWIACFSLEQGCLFAADKYGEECQDCGSDDLEIGEKYRPKAVSAFWIVLLIPNFLLFWS